MQYLGLGILKIFEITGPLWAGEFHVQIQKKKTQLTSPRKFRLQRSVLLHDKTRNRDFEEKGKHLPNFFLPVVFAVFPFYDSCADVKSFLEAYSRRTLIGQWKSLPL